MTPHNVPNVKSEKSIESGLTIKNIARPAAV